MSTKKNEIIFMRLHVTHILIWNRAGTFIFVASKSTIVDIMYYHKLTIRTEGQNLPVPSDFRRTLSKLLPWAATNLCRSPFRKRWMPLMTCTPPRTRRNLPNSTLCIFRQPQLLGHSVAVVSMQCHRQWHSQGHMRSPGWMRQIILDRPAVVHGSQGNCFTPKAWMMWYGIFRSLSTKLCRLGFSLTKLQRTKPLLHWKVPSVQQQNIMPVKLVRFHPFSCCSIPWEQRLTCALLFQNQNQFPITHSFHGWWKRILPEFLVAMAGSAIARESPATWQVPHGAYAQLCPPQRGWATVTVASGSICSHQPAWNKLTLKRSTIRCCQLHGWMLGGVGAMLAACSQAGLCGQQNHRLAAAKNQSANKYCSSPNISWQTTWWWSVPIPLCPTAERCRTILFLQPSHRPSARSNHGCVQCGTRLHRLSLYVKKAGYPTRLQKGPSRAAEYGPCHRLLLASSSPKQC